MNNQNPIAYVNGKFIFATRQTRKPNYKLRVNRERKGKNHG